MDLAHDIAAGGTVGLILGLCVAVWAYATGFTRGGSQVDKDKADEAVRRDKREAELVAERDDWKTLAQGSTPEIKRLGDLLASAMDLLAKRGIK